MRTSPRASKSSGFTLIELGAIILILALIAAAIVPRGAVVRESVRAKLSLDAVQRLASRARENAIATGRPVTLVFNETDSQFELRQDNEDGDGRVVSSAPLHYHFEPQAFAAGAYESNASDWQVTFYSDGTSDGGTVEVAEGGILRTLVLGSKSGLAKWQAGAAPANELDRWPAGEFERRG